MHDIEINKSFRFLVLFGNEYTASIGTHNSISISNVEQHIQLTDFLGYFYICFRTLWQVYFKALLMETCSIWHGQFQGMVLHVARHVTFPLQ